LFGGVHSSHFIALPPRFRYVEILMRNDGGDLSAEHAHGNRPGESPGVLAFLFSCTWPPAAPRLALSTPAQPPRATLVPHLPHLRALTSTTTTTPHSRAPLRPRPPTPVYLCSHPSTSRVFLSPTRVLAPPIHLAVSTTRVSARTIDLAVSTIRVSARPIDLAVSTIDLAVSTIRVSARTIDLAVSTIDLAVSTIRVSARPIDLAVSTIDLARSPIHPSFPSPFAHLHPA
jgi:hypothetical protein